MVLPCWLCLEGGLFFPFGYSLEPYTTDELNGTRAMKHTDFKVHNTYYYWQWGGPWLVWLLYLWWESQEVTISNTSFIVARDTQGEGESHQSCFCKAQQQHNEKQVFKCEVLCVYKIFQLLPCNLNWIFFPYICYAQKSSLS